MAVASVKVASVKVDVTAAAGAATTHVRIRWFIRLLTGHFLAHVATDSAATTTTGTNAQIAVVVATPVSKTNLLVGI